MNVFSFIEVFFEGYISRSKLTNSEDLAMVGHGQFCYSLSRRPGHRGAWLAFPPSGRGKT